jgi:hypothetical protein
MFSSIDVFVKILLLILEPRIPTWLTALFKPLKPATSSSLLQPEATCVFTAAISTPNPEICRTEYSPGFSG